MSVSNYSYHTLRGLCSSSNLDRVYTPENRPGNGQTVIYGLVRSWIEYSESDNKWVLSMYGQNTTAQSKASKRSFLLGKHSWTVEGDNFNCNEGKPYTTQLKLTGCKEGEFTCSDGQCIPMERRCDQLPDCRDESDEQECKLLVLKKGYNKNIAPVSRNSNDRVVPVNVTISIMLIAHEGCQDQRNQT